MNQKMRAFVEAHSPQHGNTGRRMVLLGMYEEPGTSLPSLPVLFLKWNQCCKDWLAECVAIQAKLNCGADFRQASMERMLRYP